MSPSLDVLAIFAHPDDAELLCGGTLARSVEAGERVGILDLTRGETGTRGSAELRAREAARAAEELGVEVRANAELPDAGLRNSLEQRHVVAEWLRRLRPRVVVTHWLEGRHPDHREAAGLVVDASFLAGLARADLEGEAHRPLKVVHALSFREDPPRPSFIVDVSDQMDRKMRALACFESQFAGMTAGGEAYPGGDRPLDEQIRAHLAHHGSRIRVRYGEPFWVREALRVDRLGDLTVSTF